MVLWMLFLVIAGIVAVVGYFIFDFGKGVGKQRQDANTDNKNKLAKRKTVIIAILATVGAFVLFMVLSFLFGVYND